MLEREPLALSLVESFWQHEFRVTSNVRGILSLGPILESAAARVCRWPLRNATMRDPRQLKVLQLADSLVLAVYTVSRTFPSDERVGLTSQIRRAAVSIPSNLIEGCSRDSPKEFGYFVTIAHGSALELQYQLSLARRLEFAPFEVIHPIEEKARSAAKMLCTLARSTGASRTRTATHRTS